MAKDNERKTTLNLLDRIADAVEDIAEGGGGGGGGGGSGSELPAVTAADNGKVLGVVDGEWAVANAADVLFAHVTIDDNTASLDKTWQEIADASLCIIVFGTTETMKFLQMVIEIGVEMDEETRYKLSTAEVTYYAQSKDDYPSAQM